MTVETIDFDLRSVCEEVAKILQPAVAERGLAMSLEYGETLPRFVNGDPIRTRQSCSIWRATQSNSRNGARCASRRPGRTAAR